ncbi:PREDICTED: CAP-Gly domain-containing linker protein 1-like isoform X2 [Amphimedon queenslandica]|uniref:SH3 domain-containing protein n=1 Tax=Amphimedon queenslandica TaxID=400682 RepID=A0AAN0J553_AMPQE|nr:PREDICTED: CAP-Gly domain-containing linker protein 1-like isoform X2 [Amphimedon queenslandica]|eukprot:XP_019851877.1 PREDICTED: CAP-Gly domain-containing linker protein 1-like isoform X2 [Amphimedon queenslandica]
MSEDKGEETRGRTVNELQRDFAELNNQFEHVKRQKDKDVEEAKEKAKEELKREHEEEMRTIKDRLREEQGEKLEEQKKQHHTELKEQEKRLKNELKEKLKNEVTKEVTDQIESSKIKKMTKSIFEVESKLAQAEAKIADLKEETANLTQTIQEKEKEHQKAIANLRKESHTDSNRQIEELKNKERQLQAKENELAAEKRTSGKLQADKEKLENELQLHKKAVGIRVPPLPPQDSSTDDSSTSSHTKTSYNELLLKNSELGFLAKKLQKDVDALTRAKTDLEGELEHMKNEVEPLRQRHKDDMTKIRDLQFQQDSKQKLLDRIKKEKSELATQIEEVKEKHSEDLIRIRNKELKIHELQRSSLDKDKKLAALKVQVKELKDEADKKEKESTIEAKAPQRPRDVSPRPYLTPPSRRAPAIDTTLAAKRVAEHKKMRDLENKVEELTSRLEELNIVRNKVMVQNDELQAALKRKEKKIQALSKENIKLKSENQLLEESKERSQKELVNEWTTSHKDLDRAHAQINRLQQQKNELQEKLGEVERRTASPDFGPRVSSPYRESPSPVLRVPSPSFSPPPSQLPVAIRRLQSSPQPLDDFGSQWSLASNESILKEQLEQIEFDKDEVSIQYEELKTSHGKLKGLHNALRERYNSLLTRSKNLHSKAKQREKERLELERELSLLQAKLKNEFDVKRETNLRERLQKSLKRITELEGTLNEQFDENENGGELAERNRQLIESNELLMLELQNKKAEVDEMESILREKVSTQGEHIKELESKLAETIGQLEGEAAISTSLKQTIQNLSEENVTGSPSKVTGSLSYKAQDCLQSVNDTVQEIKRVASADLTGPNAALCNTLVEQVERKLSEANELIKRQQVPKLPKREEDEDEEGFDDTDSAVPLTSGNSEKFQKWLEKFQSDKAALKSKVAVLEERLSEGSHRVHELQGLVTELEGRLTREQSLHVSLLAERDEHITSLSDQIQVTQKVGEKVLQALEGTNEAVEEGVDSGAIQGEVTRLDSAVKELLSTVYPRGSTPYSGESSSLSLHMISSIGPSVTTDASLSLSSSNPSPVKTAWSLNNSYPAAPVPIESGSTGGKRVPRAGRVVSKSPKSQLFVALFDYNPKSYCSTGHPERELTIKTGDVINVISDMDSSGYYTAEYKGQRGLVPAAFIQAMEISDSETQKRLLDQNLTHTSSQSHESIEVHKLAPPTMFRADRQPDGDSLLLTWVPPTLETGGDLLATGYTLYCDEAKIMDIASANIKQALLKGLDLNVPHLLGICTTSKRDLATPVSFSSSIVYYKYAGSSKRYRAMRYYDPEIDSASLSQPMSPDTLGGLEELEFDEGEILTVHGIMHENSFFYAELNGRVGLVPTNYLQEVIEPPT